MLDKKKFECKDCTVQKGREWWMPGGVAAV